MKKSIFNVFTILAFLLSLSACQNPIMSEKTPAQSISPAPDAWIKIPAASVVLHSQIHIPKENQSTVAIFTIKALYDSALGNVCMQVENNESGDLRVLCQQTQDDWQAMPLFNKVIPLN